MLIVMPVTRLIFTIILAAAIGASALSAQTAPEGPKSFDKNGLKFNYPADWVLTDKSTSQAQYLELTKPNGIGLIAIISQNKIIDSREEYARFRTDITERYVTSIRQNLAGPLGQSPDEEISCLDFNGRTVSGTVFVGTFAHLSSSGKIYSFILGKRLITLLYLRAERDRVSMDTVWNNVIKSLHSDDSNREAVGEAVSWPDNTLGELNAKATKLMNPMVTTSDWMAGLVPNRIVINVVIDETGKVIEGKVNNFMNLRIKNLAIAAAKESRFEPTVICGKPVKVWGYIIYYQKRT